MKRSNALNQISQEALIRINVQPILQLDYDIVLSPTYRVPVLYFTLRWHNYPGPVGLNAVYQYVVPEQYRQQLQSVGVMGGISFGVGAHPSPAFFSHVVVQDGGKNQDPPYHYFLFVFVLFFSFLPQRAHYDFVVSSGVWYPGLLCPPVQHCGCHDTCRT